MVVEGASVALMMLTVGVLIAVQDLGTPRPTVGEMAIMMIEVDEMRMWMWKVTSTMAEKIMTVPEMA